MLIFMMNLLLVSISLSFTLWNIHYAEASLVGVEPLMQKVHNEIRVVDTEILAAVRQQVIIFIISPLQMTV